MKFTKLSYLTKKTILDKIGEYIYIHILTHVLSNSVTHVYKSGFTQTQKVLEREISKILRKYKAIEENKNKPHIADSTWVSICF